MIFRPVPPASLCLDDITSANDVAKFQCDHEKVIQMVAVNFDLFGADETTMMAGGVIWRSRSLVVFRQDDENELCVSILNQDPAWCGSLIPDVMAELGLDGSHLIWQHPDIESRTERLVGKFAQLAQGWALQSISPSSRPECHWRLHLVRGKGEARVLHLGATDLGSWIEIEYDSTRS